MASMDSEHFGRLQHYSWAINTATLDKAMTKILDSGGCVIQYYLNSATQSVSPGSL